jgi:hypothetical protein
MFSLTTLIVATSLPCAIGFDGSSDPPPIALEMGATQSEILSRLSILENPNYSVKARMTAARELGDFGQTSVVPRLLAVLSGSEGELRTGIIRALGDLKDPRAIPMLQRIYDDSSNGPFRALTRWSMLQCDPHYYPDK